MSSVCLKNTDHIKILTCSVNAEKPLKHHRTNESNNSNGSMNKSKDTISFQMLTTLPAHHSPIFNLSPLLAQYISQTANNTIKHQDPPFHTFKETLTETHGHTYTHTLHLSAKATG